MAASHAALHRESSARPERLAGSDSTSPGLAVLKVPEIAALLRVDQKTVREIIARGELRAMRLGRRGLVRVARAVLDRYLEGRAALAAELDPEKRTLLLFALRTGAGAGEQLALEWGDLDLANKQVVPRRSMALGVVVPTKSGKETAGASQ